MNSKKQDNYKDAPDEVSSITAQPKNKNKRQKWSWCLTR